MRYLLPTVLSLTAGLLLTAIPARAADEPKPGTQVGNVIPGPFQPFNVTGPRKGKFHCLVCDYGLKPVVMIFTREPGKADTPLGKLAKGVDDAIAKDPTGTLRGFVVLLTDDERADVSKKLTEWAEAGKLKDVVLSTFASPGPSDYNLDKDNEILVVLYYKLKVVKSYPFKKGDLTDKAVETILADIEKLNPAKK
jgi:hypothetical protein